MNESNRQYANYGQYSAQWYPYEQQGSPAVMPNTTMGMTPAMMPNAPSTGMFPSGIPGQGGQLPTEQSYIENILRLNRGKVATVYTTFENNEKWNAKVFKGEILAAGRDHVILRDTQTDRRYLILMVYVDYVTFDEPIEYEYPHGLDTYPSR